MLLHFVCRCAQVGLRSVLEKVEHTAERLIALVPDGRPPDARSRSRMSVRAFATRLLRRRPRSVSINRAA